MNGASDQQLIQTLVESHGLDRGASAYLVRRFRDQVVLQLSYLPYAPIPRNTRQERDLYAATLRMRIENAAPAPLRYIDQRIKERDEQRESATEERIRKWEAGFPDSQLDRLARQVEESLPEPIKRLSITSKIRAATIRGIIKERI